MVVTALKSIFLMPTKFPFHRCISRICILSMGGLSHSNSKRKISLGDPLLRIEILRNLFYFFANFSIKKAYRISYGCTHDNDIECEKRSPKCIFDLSFCMLIFFDKKRSQSSRIYPYWLQFAEWILNKNPVIWTF